MTPMKYLNHVLLFAFIVFLTLLTVQHMSFSEEKKLASTYIADGIKDYDNGNYIEAIISLRDAEQLSPITPVSVYKYLGMSYAKLELWQQAIKEFNKILIVAPDDPERAAVLAKISEWDKQKYTIPAMAQYSFYSIKYKNRIYKQPDNLLNYLALTEVYKCSGRYTEAEQFFRALIKDRPEKIVFRKYLAEVLFLDKKYGEAGIVYKRILDEEPLNTDALIGMNLIIKKRYEDQLSKDPRNIATLLKLARVFRDLKRYEEAIDYYTKYLQTDSANEEVKRELNETEKILEVITKQT